MLVTSVSTVNDRLKDHDREHAGHRRRDRDHDQKILELDARLAGTASAVTRPDPEGVTVHSGRGWRLAPSLIALEDEVNRIWPAAPRRPTGRSGTRRTDTASLTTTRRAGGSPPST